jgi:uncharacterized protein
MCERYQQGDFEIMKKSSMVLFAITILALLLASCAAPATQAPVATQAAATEAPTTEVQLCSPEAMSPNPTPDLVIGTGGKGGVFYPFGEGLAKILTANMNGVTATSSETGGSVDNMKLIQSGEAQIGFSTVDSAYDAILGQAAYAQTGKVPACALAVLYTSFVHVIVSEASGINTIKDMKSKIISVGDSGSSTEGAADRILEAAGLDPQNEISRQNLSIADAAAALTDGKVDGFFWIGGLPTKAVSDMLSGGLKVKFVDASEYVQPMITKYGPVYSAFTLSKDVYGTEADVPGIGIGNILFVNQDMSEEQAYQILKTIFDHLDEVHALHPQAKNLVLENAAAGSSIPFHPGAIKFYTQQGVWK